MSASAFSQPSIYKAATEEARNRRLHSKLPYVHKWWARRLQVTSSALVNAALKDAGPPRGVSPVIYDPFMGMGSLVSAGLAAGCKVIAGDVSPVPFFAVSTALSAVDQIQLEKSFERMLKSVRADVGSQWVIRTSEGLRPVQFALWIRSWHARRAMSVWNYSAKELLEPLATRPTASNATLSAPNVGKLMIYRANVTDALNVGKDTIHLKES